jgi:hypothetical protein
MDSNLFALRKVVSEYTKNIFSHMGRRIKEVNVHREYAIEYFAVFSLYASGP